MALLDFIKNRGAQAPAAEQQSQQQNPETAKQKYSREAAQDTAALKPLESLPATQQKRVDDIQGDLAKATTPTQASAPDATAPLDGAASPEPQRQNMANQDKAVPDLSPTSMQAGSTSSEKETPSATVEPTSRNEPTPTPSPTPDPSPNPSPRGRGGWER